VPTKPYPWAALGRVSRAELGPLAAAQTAWVATLDPALAGEELGSLTGTTVGLEVTAFGSGSPPRRFPEVTLRAGAATVTLGVEPDLAAALLARVLGRPFALAEPGAALSPALEGALAALAVEVARRVSDVPVVLERTAVSSAGLRVEAIVRVERQAYSAYALVGGDADITRRGETADIDALGDVPLTIPLVVAASLVARADLERLVRGAAFLPSDVWVDARGHGRGVLVAATGSRGVWVDLPPDGRIVLRDATAELPFDAVGSGDTMPDANDSNDVNETLTDAALDAPVVVRVELGVVSLSARRWAELRPGDVVETGQSLGEPVVLRVAGRAVARGELVDVDGSVGVRVREVFAPSSER
jgi:flagellar motor switch/type III secretory pathway protein FliN